MTRPCPPLSPFAMPMNTLPRACMGAVVTDSPAWGGSLPTVSTQTSSPVSCRSAATSALRSGTKTSPSPRPTPCHDGTRCSSAAELPGCQRQIVSPVRPSMANTLAPPLRYRTPSSTTGVARDDTPPGSRAIHAPPSRSMVSVEMSVSVEWREPVQSPPANGQSAAG